MSLPTDLQTALDQYACGPAQLRNAVAGLTPQQLRTPAPPGQWSVLEVVCHLSDFEIVYADRMKRILAEDQPTFFSGDPDKFAARLDYTRRDLEEELAVIASVRAQVARILRNAASGDFERIGIHSEDGPLTLATLLGRIAEHIPHHVEFIVKKRPAL